MFKMQMAHTNSFYKDLITIITIEIIIYANDVNTIEYFSQKFIYN